MGRDRCQITKDRVRGKKFFQMRCISWSYRNRGYEARTHKNKTDKRVALIIRLIVVTCGRDGIWDAPKKRVADKVFMRRILAYSARKNRAKGPPAYSTLKPETNSDSPSVRSKGARLVSARVEMYHIAARGQAGIISHTASCVIPNACRVKLPVNTIDANKIKPKLTS